MTKQPGAEGEGTGTSEASQAMAQMIMGFRVTQLIYVVAKLGIADLLRNGPQGAEALATATGANAPALYRLLRGLASLGVFAEDDQGRFGLTPLAELLQTGVPGSQRARALYFGATPSWNTWGQMLYSVTTGAPAFPHLHGKDPWEYRANDPEWNATFDDFMTLQTAFQTPAIVAAYDFAGISTLVDVGGGHGTLIASILQANPRMQGILCDAPHVVTGAQRVLQAAGVLDRCQIVPCDFFSSVPAGGDAYILKSIIHDWDDEHAVAILKSCRRVMSEGGQLLLVENIIPPGNNPNPAKLTDLQMLVALGGRERSEAEFRALLAEAGFRLTQIVPTMDVMSIIRGIAE